MSRELVFTVSPGLAQPAEPVSFADIGLEERKDLQEWVLAHPTILGADVKVVSFEFDSWEAGDGVPTYDRLDVLALDRSGRLVVAELKRDRAPNTITIQALNYAAMVSRFSLDTVVQAYARYRDKHDAAKITEEQAEQELLEWAPEVSDETLGPPDIVLVATDFGPQITNTAMFLYENRLSIRLMQVRLYRTGPDQIVLTTSQLLPVPAAERFMIRPRSAPAVQAAARAAREYRASIPERLVAQGVFSEGQELRIVVPAKAAEDRDAIERWLAEDPLRTVVTWQQDARAPVVWRVDGEAYNLTTLIRHVIRQATGEAERTQVWGPNWYRDGSGRVLHKIVEAG